MNDSTTPENCLAFFRSVIKCGEAWSETCDRDFAQATQGLRALRARNSELEAALERLTALVDRHAERINELAKSVAIVAEDTARMDWLEKTEGTEWAVDWGLGLWDGDTDRKRTIRDAVDIKREEKP